MLVSNWTTIEVIKLGNECGLLPAEPGYRCCPQFCASDHLAVPPLQCGPAMAGRTLNVSTHQSTDSLHDEVFIMQCFCSSTCVCCHWLSQSESADEETLLASEERELAKWWALQIDDYQGEINHYTGLHTHTKIVRPLSAALPVSLTMELERAVTHGQPSQRRPEPHPQQRLRSADIALHSLIRGRVNNVEDLKA